LLVTKEELVTDLTNIMYRHTDAVEKLTKIQADSDKQLVDIMKQIKDLAADRDLKAKQLADLEAAAQVIVEMVEEGEAGDKTLVKRLHEAPQKITSFLSHTSKQYLAHALGLVKSFLACSKLGSYWRWVS
jgi:CHASE3 domain sensor protein